MFTNTMRHADIYTWERVCACVCALTHRKVLQNGCGKMGLRWEFMLVQRFFFFFCHGVEDASDEQVTYGFQICLSILKELIALIHFF